MKKVGPQAPNLNAIAEQWVQSCGREMLDHLVVFGEEHLRYLIAEYVTHYNQERAHQAMDNLPLTGLPPPPGLPLPLEEVDYRERLSGLLKHFYPSRRLKAGFGESTAPRPPCAPESHQPLLCS